MKEVFRNQTIWRVSKALLTILLLWIGFITFALLMTLLGLRGDPISSTFSEVQAQLHSNADTHDLALSRAQVGHFDNALVYLYLVPVLAVRWIGAFAKERSLSPVPVLIAVLCLAIALGIAFAVLGLLADIGLPLLLPPYTSHPDLVFVPHPGHLLDGAVFLFGVVPAVTLCGLASLVGLPLLLIHWFRIFPGKLDRYLHGILDLQSGQLATRHGHVASYVSNTLLLAIVAIPTSIGLWWICDLLDGIGGNSFAFAARGCVIAICIFTLTNAHLRAFGHDLPIPAS